jgi:3D (Asp-Asp-Asp) domain-containing protein
MQPPKFLTSTAGFTLIAAVCTATILPSCAFKRFVDRGQTESVAANAEALEDALAILDRAIEETAPASEISAIPLNVPAHPEDLEKDSNVTPVVIQIPGSETEISTADTLFEVSSESSREAAAAPIELLDPAADDSDLTIDSAPAKSQMGPQPRQRIVVNRPSPSYRPESLTTPAIDEFRTVRTTAYSHTEADHIKYGELSAMGKPLRFGMVRSAAADWSRYPVGTRFRIVGKPYEYVIDDYGSALVGTDTIDLYKPSGERMDDWGAREIEIEIIAWGSFGKSLAILEPRREMGEHIEQMISAISDQPQRGAIADGGNDASILPHE